MSDPSIFNQSEQTLFKRQNSDSQKWQTCSHCQDSLVRHLRLGTRYWRCSCRCVVVNLL